MKVRKKKERLIPVIAVFSSSVITYGSLLYAIKTCTVIFPMNGPHSDAYKYSD